jgi:hypothetical protein
VTRPVFRSTLSLTGITGLVGAGLIVGWTAPAVADEACLSTTDSPVVTCTYLASGTEHVFIVPDGVTSMAVTAVGGTGGRAADGPAAGQPAAVAGTLTVSPGGTLFLAVGGNGGDGVRATGGATASGGRGGSNGGTPGADAVSTLDTPGVSGAGGGGASDVRTISRSQYGSLESRLLVAAGSGGGAALTAGGAGDPTVWSYAEPVASPAAEVPSSGTPDTDSSAHTTAPDTPNEVESPAEPSDEPAGEPAEEPTTVPDDESAVAGSDDEAAVAGPDAEAAVGGADAEAAVAGPDTEALPVLPLEQWRAEGRYGVGTPGTASSDSCCASGGGGGGGVFGGLGGAPGTAGSGGTSLVPAGGASFPADGPASIVITYTPSTDAQVPPATAEPVVGPVPEAEPVPVVAAEPVVEPAPVLVPLAPVAAAADDKTIHSWTPPSWRADHGMTPTDNGDEGDVLEVTASPSLDTVALDAIAPAEGTRLFDTDGVGMLAAVQLGSVTLALAVGIFVAVRRRAGE